MTVDEPLRRLAQSQAQAMLADLSGVVAVIVASVDGFDVASAVTRNVDPARVAAHDPRRRHRRRVGRHEAGG